MKKLLCAALALIMLALSACASAGEVTVWRAVRTPYLTGGSAVKAEEAPADAGLSEIEAAVRAFNSPCIDSELAHPFLDGVEIIGWELANASLRLYVPAEYAALTGAERTVADCCAVLTFTAIEGVESVSIWSGDVMLSAPMRAGDFAAADASGY